MSLTDFADWVCTGAMLAVFVCSLLLAFRRPYPPLLRFGPVAVVAVYVVAGLIHFLVEGVAAFLVIPAGCFALFLGVRMLSHRSALSYTFAASTFVFWPVVILTFSRYLMLVHLRR